MNIYQNGAKVGYARPDGTIWREGLGAGEKVGRVDQMPELQIVCAGALLLVLN